MTGLKFPPHQDDQPETTVVLGLLVLLALLIVLFWAMGQA